MPKILHKTLWQIINGAPDNLTLETEAIQYIKDLTELFEKKEVSGEDLVMVATEMLPSDEEQLDVMEAKVNAALNGEPQGFTSSMGEHALITFYSAIMNKKNLEQTLLQEISERQQRIAVLSNQGDAKPEDTKQNDAKKDDKENLAYVETLQGHQKEIEKLHHAIYVKNKMTALTDNKRAERIITAIASIESLLRDLPESITKYFVGERTLAEQIQLMKDNHTQIVRLSHEHNLNSDLLHEHVEKANASVNQIISILAAGLNKELFAIRGTVSQATYSSMEADMKSFINYAASLAEPEANMQTYITLVDNFQNKLLDLLSKIEGAPVELSEIDHRVANRLAIQQADSSFDAAQYPYQLKGKDLRSSKNPFFSDQLEYNSVGIADESKFIIMGKLHDNLFQIRKDAERIATTINGQHIEEGLSDNDLKALLVREFGQEGTNNIIRHFDQSVAMLISAPINKSVIGTLGATSPIFTGAALEHHEDIYLKNGVVYRDVESDHIRIMIQKDDGDIDTWKFKANIKVSSALSKDGFSVLKMGTDSDLICDALMSHNVFKDVEKMIKVIQHAENEFLSKQEKFTKELPASQYKLDIMNKMLGEIDKFKTGKISLDELVVVVKAESLKAVPHLGVLGKFRGAVSGKEPGVKEVIVSFSDQLKLFKEGLNEKVGKYKQVDLPSPTLSISSPSRSRS
jgi:hypothetical protein